MTSGQVAVGAIMLAAVLGGGFLWYTAERAFYAPVAFAPGDEIRLVTTATGAPQPIAVTEITGIDATSSPIKFRACFQTLVPLDQLRATYQPYPDAQPLIAPSNFPCFDAKTIGLALENGQAVAFLSQPEIRPGVDRVVAIFPDGRGYAWNQLNKAFKD